VERSSGLRNAKRVVEDCCWEMARVEMVGGTPVFYSVLMMMT
jgi:hypothetical protein